MPSPQKVIAVIDDDPEMLKAIGRLLKAAGFDSETFASARSSTEIDLGCILGGNDPPSATRRRGALRRGVQDFLWGDMRRIQKAVCRHLSGPITSDLA